MKWAQTMPDTLFGPFISFFFHSFHVLSLLTAVIGTIYLQKGLGKAAAMKTGPNNAICVIWAICKVFFFSFYHFLLILTNVFKLKVQGGLRKAAMTKTGPNDARHIVWAISTFFLYL